MTTDQLKTEFDLKLKLIEKDIEVLRLQHNEFKEFMQKQQTLAFKMDTLESKLEEVNKRLEKSSSFWGGIGTKLIEWLILGILAATVSFGTIKVAGPTQTINQNAPSVNQIK